MSKRPLYQQEEDKDACFYKRGNLKLSKCPTEHISTADRKTRVNTEWQHVCIHVHSWICRKCFIPLCEQSRSTTRMPITLQNTANKRVGGHVFKTVSNKHLWKFIFIWALKVILLNVTLIDHRQCLRSGLRRSYHSLCLRLLWVLLLLTNHVRSLFFQRQMMRVLFTCRIFPQKEEMKIILEVMKNYAALWKTYTFL